ncbi:uncharacterized protein [Haliotis asinina]|uniref:uncharacterized protein n=1 Tax=Haliotis asinina TaxID=109174 RepID=UPI003532808B
MEDRSTSATTATTALQGRNENHGHDTEGEVMAISSTTTTVTSTLQGGIQVGNHNNIIYRNCAITNITNITHTTNKCKDCHPAEEHDVSEDTSPDMRPSSSVHTTTRVRLFDCQGRELELGDIVDTDRIDGIYAGDGMIIGVDRKTRKIVHEPIKVEEPFSSAPGRSPVYSRVQVIQRAKGKVGQRYTYRPVDFVVWCLIGLTWKTWFAHIRLLDPKHDTICLRHMNADY